LELGAFAAFAYWGAKTGPTALAVVLACVAPALAIVSWAILAAPKSPRRLPRAARLPFELSVFALAAAALFVAVSPVVAIAFAIVVLVNAALLVAFDQLDA
jgi:phosphoglycerol transferase MdoB-like AlkP superfamily enzyme